MAGRKAIVRLPDVIWDAIKLEFLKGVMPRILARKYGVEERTITRRAERGEWRVTREKILQKIEQTMTARMATDATKAHADTFVKRVKQQVDAGLNVLEANPPEIETLERHGRTLETLARVGRQAHALDDEAGRNVTLNLTMLRQEPEHQLEPIEAELLSENCPAKEPLSLVETTD